MSKILLYRFPEFLNILQWVKNKNRKILKYLHTFSKISDFQKLNDVILIHAIFLIRYFLLRICKCISQEKISQDFYNPVNLTYTYFFISLKHFKSILIHEISIMSDLTSVWHFRKMIYMENKVCVSKFIAIDFCMQIYFVCRQKRNLVFDNESSINRSGAVRALTATSNRNG